MNTQALQYLSGFVGVVLIVAASRWQPPEPLRAVVIILGVAAVLTSILLSNRTERARTAAISTWADALGWTFVPNRDTGQGEEFPQFPVFQTVLRRDCVAYNIVRGSLDIAGRSYPFKCGDVLIGRGRSVRNSSYIVLTIPTLATAGLEIRDADWMDELVANAGFPSVQFESEAFDRRFHVTATDRKFASDVISQATIEFLMSKPPPARVVTINRAQMCLISEVTRWDLDQFNAVISWSQRFLALWPAFLFDSPSPQ